MVRIPLQPPHYICRHVEPREERRAARIVEQVDGQEGYGDVGGEVVGEGVVEVRERVVRRRLACAHAAAARAEAVTADGGDVGEGEVTEPTRQTGTNRGRPRCRSGILVVWRLPAASFGAPEQTLKTELTT